MIDFVDLEPARQVYIFGKGFESVARKGLWWYLYRGIMVCLILISVYLLIYLYWIVDETEDYEPTEFYFEVDSVEKHLSNGSTRWNASVRITDVSPREYPRDSGLWREFGLKIKLRDGTNAYEYAKISTFDGNLTDTPSFFVTIDDSCKVDVGDTLVLSGLDESYEGAKVQFIHCDEIWGTFYLPKTFS
jgi:hypothetical protein